MKRLSLAILLLLTITFYINAQQHISVDLGSPVYQLLDNAEQRGLIPILPASRPYAKSQVLRYLNMIKENQMQLSSYERFLLNSYIEGLETFETGYLNGNVGGEGNLGSIYFGMSEETNLRVNLNNPGYYHNDNNISGAFFGDIFSFASFNTVFGVTYDKIAPDIFFETKQFPTEDLSVIGENGTYAPYSYSKHYTGLHLSTEGREYYSTYDGYMFSTAFQNELTASFYDGNILMRLGNVRREWGKGDGSLNLSSTARPFEALETHFRFADWVSLSYMFGSLGNYNGEKIKNETYDSNQPISWDNYPYEMYSEQKMLTLQMVEITPFDWMHIAYTSSVIWGKRFEIGYMSPMVISMFYQFTQGDMDNVGQSLSAAFIIPYLGKIHGSVYMDEAKPKPLDDVRNLLAYQLGLETPIAKLPFASVLFQYTKIEPFVYAHYSEEGYPTYAPYSVGLSYTHDGENLAYYLPPNSDEFLIRFEALPLPTLYASLTYKLIRHGTNPFVDSDGDGLPDNTDIYGHINIPINYGLYDNGDYGSKDFLHDGIYDWSNVVELSLIYSFENVPVTVGFDYIFSHTFWEGNGYSGEIPDPVTQNILAFNLKIFR